MKKLAFLLALFILAGCAAHRQTAVQTVKSDSARITDSSVVIHTATRWYLQPKSISETSPHEKLIFMGYTDTVRLVRYVNAVRAQVQNAKKNIRPRHVRKRQKPSATGSHLAKTTFLVILGFSLMALMMLLKKRFF